MFGGLYFGEYWPTYGPVVPPSFTGEPYATASVIPLLSGMASASALLEAGASVQVLITGAAD